MRCGGSSQLWITQILARCVLLLLLLLPLLLLQLLRAWVRRCASCGILCRYPPVYHPHALCAATRSRRGLRCRLCCCDVWDHGHASKQRPWLDPLCTDHKGAGAVTHWSQHEPVACLEAQLGCCYCEAIDDTAMLAISAGRCFIAICCRRDVYDDIHSL